MTAVLTVSIHLATWLSFKPVAHGILANEKEENNNYIVEERFFVNHVMRI
jgi:hypothetical protein